METNQGTAELTARYRRNASVARTGLLGAIASLINGTLLLAMYSKTHAPLAIVFASIQLPLFVWCLYLGFKARRYTEENPLPSSSILNLSSDSR
jgi:hypothetical protein